MIQLLDNEYITIGVIIVSSLIISFRNNIQNTIILEKIFTHSFFKILLLSIITYISQKNNLIGLTFAIVYLVIDTYINNLPIEDTSKYTNPYKFDNTNTNNNTDTNNNDNTSTSAIQEEPKAINETKEGFNNILDGNTIGDIIDQSRTHCDGHNKTLPSCKSIVGKTQQINVLALDILNMCDKMKNKNKNKINIHNNQEEDLEKTILEQQSKGGLEGFDNTITKIMDKYKEIN